MNRAARLAELYRQVILANAARPCGMDEDIPATHRASRNNPLCGDDIEVRFQVVDGAIRTAAFSGEACAICLASASLLCRHAPGLGTEQLATLATGFRKALSGASGDCADFLAPLLGVRSYPARIACATLPWETGLAALDGANSLPA